MLRSFVRLASLLALIPVGGSAAPPVPPAEHPRLYFRTADLPMLRQRLTHPRMIPVWDKVLKAAKNKPDGLKLSDLGTLAAAKALIGVLNNDAQSSREAVELVRGYLPTAAFDMSIQDVSRPIGALMINSAMVYDWCYSLLSREDKDLSPANPEAETDFVNVMQVMNAETTPLPVARVESGPLSGVRVGDRIVLFNMNANTFTGSVNFDAGSGAKVIVTGIEPGQWRVRRNGRDTVLTATSVLDFEASGRVTLSK